jgi:UDP-N-acetylmuramyl pentapeptide phosphotransferase/UDP-N-acetylglucosamine-1-phosphate transferase
VDEYGGDPGRPDLHRDAAQLLDRGDHLLQAAAQHHSLFAHVTTAGLVLAMLSLLSMLIAPRLTIFALRRLGWMEANFRGDRIPQSLGTAILLAALILLPACDLLAPSSHASTWLLAASGFGLLGLLDDRLGDKRIKGLRGHFRAALRERRITTGFIKAIGGTALAILIGFRLTPGAPAHALLNAGLIALTANCINLLDLRPGRAGAVFLVSAGLLLLAADTGHTLLPLLLIALCALPVYSRDARGAAMMGDAGSNLLGACLGVGIAASALGPIAKVTILAALAGLHLITERVSLTALIERTPPLRALDRLTGIR